MTAVEPLSWREGAACRGLPTAWWFFTDPVGEAAAVKFCSRCAVRTACLDAAIADEVEATRGVQGKAVRPFVSGVRGGVAPAKRAAMVRVLREQRRQALAERSG